MKLSQKKKNRTFISISILIIVHILLLLLMIVIGSSLREAILLSGLSLLVVSIYMSHIFWMSFYSRYIFKKQLSGIESKLKTKGVFLTETNMGKFQNELDILTMDPTQIRACYQVIDNECFLLICDTQKDDDAVFSLDVPTYFIISKTLIEQSIDSHVYLTLPNDLLFNILKNNNSNLTRLESNEFEKMFRIETDNEINARYILDPVKMSDFLDTAFISKIKLLRIHWTENYQVTLSRGFLFPTSSEQNPDLLNEHTVESMVDAILTHSQIIKI